MTVDVMIAESHYIQALLDKVLVPLFIALPTRLLVVLRTVEFYHQLGLRTVEIYDIGSELLLPSEGRNIGLEKIIP